MEKSRYSELAVFSHNGKEDAISLVPTALLCLSDFSPYFELVVGPAVYLRPSSSSFLPTIFAFSLLSSSPPLLLHSVISVTSIA